MLATAIMVLMLRVQEFFPQMMDFAYELVHGGDVEKATIVYSALANSDSSYAQKAIEKLGALAGNEKLGDRLEVGLPQLVRDLTDPIGFVIGIVTMAAIGMAGLLIWRVLRGLYHAF